MREATAPALASEQAPHATDAPGNSGPLAPPPFPVGADAPRPTRQAPKTIPIPTSEWDTQPSVAPDRWVTREELLSTSQHAAFGSRNPYASKRRRPLPQPRRFRRMARWQSWSVLVLAAVCTVVVVIGAVKASPLGAKSHAPAATATPTVVQHHTATATSAPKK